MPVFNYIAFGENGIPQKGSTLAANKREAAMHLQELSLLPISLKKQSVIGSISKKTASTRRLAQFCCQMEVLIKAGLSVKEALELQVNHNRDEGWNQVCERLIESVESGKTLSMGMEAVPGYFPSRLIFVIRAGEEGGCLEGAFKQLADTLEREASMRGKIRTAMIYPAILLLTAIGALVLFIFTVLPAFSGMYRSLNLELPVITLLFMDVADNFFMYVTMALAICVVIILLGAIFYKSAYGRYQTDKILTGLPFLGDLIMSVEYMCGMYTFCALIESGIVVDRAAKISGETIQNRYLSTHMKKLSELMHHGCSFEKSCGMVKGIPAKVQSYVIAGESSGELALMLRLLAEDYRQRAEEMTKTMEVMLEPAMVLILGIITGAIVISMLYPMFSLLNKF